MTLSIKYKELVDAIPVLTVLASTAMPVVPGAQIRRVLDHARVELDAFERERTALCVEAADKDENGKPVMQDGEDGKKEYKISDKDARTALEQKYEQLLTVPVEIKGSAIKLESLADVKIPPSFLLPWLFEI